jgi:formylglycine-generating enzyme required for sulfatase activity
MLFPTIEEYKDAIRIAEHSLATLKEYEVVKTTAGEPWFSSGNFAVVFKMKHRRTGKLLALKCFTRFQERRQESYKLISAHLGTNKSPYLLHYNYLDNEIWAAGAEYPVVAMEWADGATLGDYVKEQCRLNNKANLQVLAQNFEALTAWLITQPFAHGDLKPDNIIVRRDGSLVLVDYDGMFVPAMQGQQAREFGSAVYRHPKRTIDTFDRYIDDFSLLVLLLELRLIASDTKHYSAALSGDSIVAKSGDWEDVGSSQIYQALQTQGGVDWANWAAMLFIVPKSAMHQELDWSLLIDINTKAVAQLKIINSPVDSEFANFLSFEDYKEQFKINIQPIEIRDLTGFVFDPELFDYIQKFGDPRTSTGFVDPFEGQMVFVQGGSFMMGSNDGSGNEKPEHQVTLSNFYIGKFQVTQVQWKAIMGDNPSYYKGDDLPVESVSWYDVQEFIKKMKEKTGRIYRLPTEAEWEYAAQGGQNSKGYKYAGSDNLSEVAWYADNSGSKTHPVGQKKSNELGLYDMSGNVWEWCADWYGSDYYKNSPKNNPTGPVNGSNSVRRGGSWDGHAGICRVSRRSRYTPDLRGYRLGFRLLRTA